MEELVTGRDGFLVELKSDPGPLGLDTLLEEIVKLGRAKAIGLLADLLSGYSEKLVAAWRTRAAACYPSDLLANPRAVRLTLLAALCWSRTSEISDAREPPYLADTVRFGMAVQELLHPRFKATDAVSEQHPLQRVLCVLDAVTFKLLLGKSRTVTGHLHPGFQV